MTRVLPWIPLAAALLHMGEEFVLPGGFDAWYRAYRREPGRITRRFLIAINAALLVACLNIALIGRHPIGAAYWLLIAGVLASNGMWHAWATYRSGRYSPGVVTGVLLYLPMAGYGLLAWTGSGIVSIGIAAPLFAIGCSYHLWSYLYHRPAGLPR